MNIRMTVTLAAALSAVASFGGIRALTHDNYGGKANAWQIKRHNEKMGVVTNGGAKVVFVGDSITHNWENAGKAQFAKFFRAGGRRALNLGCGADRTEHLLWRLNEGGELDGYEAKCVLLMIGTNNTGHFPFEKEPPADTILGIREVVRTIRAKQPKAVVVLMPIFPRGRDMNDGNRRRNEVVNREIWKFADGQTVFWCDFNEQFLTPEGFLPAEIMPDRLHPNALGYEVWAAAVKPYVDYALSDGKLPAPANRFAPLLRKESVRLDQPAAAYPATRIRSDGLVAPDWWLDRLMRNRNQIADAKGEIDVVMLGDSITHNWENAGKESLAELRKTYTVLDAGYGGDRTEHLLWRIRNGELDGYKAKCVTLMIGTNNENSRHSPQQIAAGIKEILAVVAKKQPQAKVVLMPIFPRGESATNAHRVNNEKVNAIIKGYADGAKVIWLDFNAKFLDATGDTLWIMPDRLHPNADGYKNIWLPALLPHLKAICGK